MAYFAMGGKTHLPPIKWVAAFDPAQTLICSKDAQCSDYEVNVVGHEAVKQGAEEGQREGGRGR